MAKHIDIVAGLAFGDDGKSQLVDFLAAEHNATLVVRYNGGPSTGGYIDDGNGKRFSATHIGCGVLSGAETYLSKYVRFDPVRAVIETSNLQKIGIENALENLLVDGEALVVTPWHAAASQYNAQFEKRGTCGTGSGETVRFSERYPELAVRVKDLRDRSLVRDKLHGIQSFYQFYAAEDEFLSGFENPVRDMAEFFYVVADAIRITNQQDWLNLLAKHDNIIFQGAQAVLLDRERGFKPYVTSSNTTFENADELLADYTGKREYFGCTRMYASRHGNGPLPTENEILTRMFEEKHNIPNQYQGATRLGWFDTALLQKSLSFVPQTNYLAVSHLDNFSKSASWLIAEPRDNVLDTPTYASFSRLTDYLRYIEKTLDREIKIVADGATRKDRQWVR